MSFLAQHYVTIKYLHTVTAALSILLFCTRFVLLQTDGAAVRARWLKILPHVNDTLLLALAIVLCVIIQQAPGVTPWLSEKVSAVVLYIFAGMWAMKWAKSRRGRLLWFIIAIAAFCYAANRAIAKSPLLF